MITVIENTKGKYPVYSVINSETGKLYCETVNKEHAYNMQETLEASVSLNNLIAS